MNSIKKYITYSYFSLLCVFSACYSQQTAHKDTQTPASSVTVGAARLPSYLPLLQNKKVALVVNQTSVIGNTHLVDTLLTYNVKIQKIFAPEHGFRGTADAGEKINNAKDSRTGLPLLSLYGKDKKPSAEQLADVEVVIFDIQDVGARFYTYISTMHYVMEACAENNKHCIVLDRPNPNGHYVDGMVLQSAHQSFVGMHPIPVVHGLTVGELAKMINGEKWLANAKTCPLTVITCENYTHQTPYSLPIKPSPNLPNDISIALYPSLCFFEGTVVSVGRGTDFPFQVIGYPDYPQKDFSFTPVSKEGAKNPPYLNQLCYGTDYRQNNFEKYNFSLQPLIHYYQTAKNKATFFNDFFTKLAGTKQLRQQIEAGMTEEEIRATWQADLTQYKQMREKYLLYQ
jgi:uncharacterized protein YbbC (DUF1343 family)